MPWPARPEARELVQEQEQGRLQAGRVLPVRDKKPGGAVLTLLLVLFLLPSYYRGRRRRRRCYRRRKVVVVVVIGLLVLGAGGDCQRVTVLTQPRGAGL